MLETITTKLYFLEQFSDNLVNNQLNHLNFLSIGIIFIAGLLTSLTPCMLSMLPITIGYIGGYENKGRINALIQSSWFALGLATTLAALGIFAATLGKVYGQIGFGLPIIVSLIAIMMGLNLLEILPLRLPSLGATDWITEDLPDGVRSYLFGLTFGLIASPCSTPVLITLLAWVADQQNVLMGIVLLLAYAVGYVAPLVLAGSFTASIKKMLEIRRWSAWLTPASGALLLGFGVFSLLSRLNLGLIIGNG